MRTSRIVEYPLAAQTAVIDSERGTTTMSTPSKTVLVLGANGRFGQAAVQAFASAGWSVLAQARRAPARALPAGARSVTVALDDADALAAVARGTSVLVHALNPPYTRWSQELLPLARQGMALAQRLDACFMLPGNVYNYGASMPTLLQVDTPQHPSTAKGRLRCALEVEMQSRAAAGLRSVIIRAGDFFGSGQGSWLDLAVLKSLRQGQLVYPGPTEVPHAWAYLPDLARAFVAVAARDDLSAFARLHFAGHTLTGRQLLAAVQRAAGRLGLAPAQGWRQGTMPWALMRAGALFVPMWREVLDMAYLWRVPHALDGSALAAAVGELPATPIDVALQSALLDLGFGAAETATQAQTA
jgi:nucleoside-diphosphate-sugar epimerase